VRVETKRRCGSARVVFVDDRDRHRHIERETEMIERGGFSSGERMRLALGGALLAACVLATIGLRFVPAYAPFAITGRTHAAMRTGDLRTLRRLGMHDAVQDLVEVEGRIELAELLAIEREARNVGAAEYQRLARVVTDAGAQRFSALGRQEQARIREASLVTFLITEGARAANVGLPPGTEPTTFAPSVPDVEVATRLGRASLGAADAARLGDRTAADPALAADLSLLSLAVDAAESGERIYLATRRRLMDAGEGVFRALDFDAQQRVRNASYSEFVYTQGFADVRGREGASRPRRRPHRHDCGERAASRPRSGCARASEA